MKNNFKEKRKKLNLTQKEIADKLQIDEATYRRYELGRSEPRARRCIAIAKVLKTTVEELFP